MRGAVYDRFGDESVLQVRDDLPTPPVGPDVVLVRASAAGVNPVDIGIRSGRLTAAYPHHFPIIPGWDLSGVVEQVGPAVVDFAPGDEVFAYVRRDHVQWGTTAELVPVPLRCAAHKPESLSFAEAGALPLAGLTAYQSVTEALAVGEGDRVLVHRAAGGVGFFAVQIAVALGAHVIGTASPRNHGFLRDAGVAEVLDYSAGPI
ncbi:MAG TPA: NADP-dependent oxidoreductase, partial [Blastococcus sp.]